MKGPKQVVDAYIMPIVRAAIDSKPSSSQGQNDGEESTPNMLEYLVSQTEGTSLIFLTRLTHRRWGLDPNLVRDALLAFLLAGRDTVCDKISVKGWELIALF